MSAKPARTDEILALFDAWAAALESRDPDKVVELYADDAVLLPTLSNKVRHNREEIRDYFELLLQKGPVGKIDEANVRVFDDVAVTSGAYTFTFADATVIPARFTFVYGRRDEGWEILEHHSSAMPE